MVASPPRESPTEQPEAIASPGGDTWAPNAVGVGGAYLIPAAVRMRSLTADDFQRFVPPRCIRINSSGSRARSSSPTTTLYGGSRLSNQRASAVPSQTRSVFYSWRILVEFFLRNVKLTLQNESRSPAGFTAAADPSPPDRQPVRRSGGSCNRGTTFLLSVPTGVLCLARIRPENSSCPRSVYRPASSVIASS